MPISDTISSFKLRGTHITTPYPLKLTPAETRLAFSLERSFLPANIFPEYYTLKVNSNSRHTADLTEFTLGASRHDLSGSEFVQIDCLAINQYGIFIFESKDYSGYIFGRGSDQRWTATLNFGAEKNTFYNPVRQNRLHLDAINDFLAGLMPTLPIFSVIVFGPDATLKKVTDLPPRTAVCNQSALRTTLHQLSPTSLLSDDLLANIRHRIIIHQIIPNDHLRANHTADITDSLSKNS